ncbi:MAG: MipA/OmpV family protein [Gammaproteobacteria bacterium]|nr:MipA/OmpV family protein [Gammaproteobacteria bacterium]
MQLLGCALLACLATVAVAQEIWRVPAPDTGQVVTPGLGAGARGGTNIYRGENPYGDIFPLYMLDSRWLFAEGNVGGLHLVRNARWQFDVIARYRFDQFKPDINRPGDENLQTRKQTTDAGLAAEYRANWGELRAVWVTDAQSRHRGQEFELTYRRGFDRGDWFFAPYLTLSWQDEDLTGYYFGVSPEEAAPGTPVYRPDDAFNAAVGLNTRWMLTDRIFLQGNVAFKVYASSISDSPIVDDSVDANAFIGAGYLFDGPYDRNKRDKLGAGQGLWTYRVNYGYAAEENIFPLLMAGVWEESTEGRTDLVGLTIGRLLRPGKRADVYARLATIRHFEKGLQDDTWSFAGSLMIIGRGYLPWSDKPAFRWGFGWGASYSVDLLAIERIKQANRGDKNNQFLGYMEWQVDVPIDLLFKSKLTRNCFVGASVMHRSGMWGFATFFGDVSGGSDFVGFHVECVR